MFRFVLGFALGGLVAALLLLWYIWRVEEKSAPDHGEMAAFLDGGPLLDSDEPLGPAR
jgi:hypothetical protein